MLTFPSAAHANKLTPIPLVGSPAPRRVSDYPSNALISLQTSLSLLSLDPLAYPTAVALHALHALTRLPTFAAALPSWRDYFSLGKVVPGRYEGMEAVGSADERLERLRRGAERGGGMWAGRVVSRKAQRETKGCEMAG